MAEWTQPNSPESPASPETSQLSTSEAPSKKDAKKTVSKKKYAVALAGTAVVALTAGVLFQVFKADDANAKVEEKPQQQRYQYLARVNNELVTWDEVATECVKRYGTEVLDNIVNRKIVQQACQAKGIQVTEEEVTKEITEIAGRFNMPVETWYQLLKAERNLTPDQYRRDIIWPMIALKKLAGENVQITEQDITTAFVRDYGPRVKVKVIMLDNFRRAKEAYEALRKAPADFEKLVHEYSIEPNSRALDGVIPPIHRFYPNEKLEAAAFALQEGQISGIVEIGVSRYVILKSEGFTKPEVAKLEDVKDELYRQIHEERVQEAIAKVFNTLKQQARVDNYLTNQSTIQQTSGVATTPGSNPKRPTVPFNETVPSQQQQQPAGN